MGRGRAKAKQAKVARDLKYATHPVDLAKLAQELKGSSSHTRNSSANYDDPSSDESERDELGSSDPDYPDPPLEDDFSAPSRATPRSK